MLLFLLILTILSVIASVMGVIWTLAVAGRSRTRSGPDVGAGISAEQMADEEDGVVLAQATAFKGKATSIESSAEFSFAEIKGVLKAGKWREVFPILLALGGLLGLLLFGSLALLFGVENKLVGAIVAVVALYAFVRTLISIARS